MTQDRLDQGMAASVGLEAVLSGLRNVHTDDDALNLAAAIVFDALHATPGQTA
jgi:hypothetical protein